MHKILRIDGQRHDVQVHVAGGTYEVKVGDEATLAGERRWEGARLVLEPASGGRRVVAHLTRGTGGRLELWIDSERHGIEEERRGAAGADDHADGDDALVAPMPAKVVRIEVAPGDAVEEGQTLVVLESMKMELGITAPRAGRIARVGAVVGVIVPAGTMLVELEPRTGVTP